MAEEMENDLNSMQQENSLINQIVLSEDDGESPQLLMSSTSIQQQNELDEEIESFPLLENTGTARQVQPFFNLIRRNSLHDEQRPLVIVFSVDPVNEFMMFYYNYGDEIREEIIENSLVMLVIVTEGYGLSEGPGEIHSQEQSHLNNLIITQTQQQNTLDFEAESVFSSEEHTGARSHGTQVQQYNNLIQQNSLADESYELVFSVDPVNEFMMFRYNLSEEIWEEP